MAHQGARNHRHADLGVAVERHAASGAEDLVALASLAPIPLRELSNREREILIEEPTMAWHSRSPDGPTLEHHTWADLDAAARQMVFDESFIMCVLEAGLDRDAYSTVVRAVAAATARG